jgi:signal recognition particle receptor subunit beta
MATINYAAKEISVKIVYYGPGLSGKTTNLQVIHRKIPVDTRSDMVSLATETDRTLFFDFLPLDLGKIRGFTTKFQLYTVPGQVYYNATRKLVLRGVDGIVFVADSASNKMDENLESFRNMEENLAEYGYKRETIPVILQYNKRDVPNAVHINELNNLINKHNYPWNEAIANKAKGVFESLKLIGKLVIDHLNQKYASPAQKQYPQSQQQRPTQALPVQPGTFTRPQAPYMPQQQQEQDSFLQPPPVAKPQQFQPIPPTFPARQPQTQYGAINLEPMGKTQLPPSSNPFASSPTSKSPLEQEMDSYYSKISQNQSPQELPKNQSVSQFQQPLQQMPLQQYPPAPQQRREAFDEVTFEPKYSDPPSYQQSPMPPAQQAPQYRPPQAPPQYRQAQMPSSMPQEPQYLPESFQPQPFQYPQNQQQFDNQANYPNYSQQPSERNASEAKEDNEYSLEDSSGETPMYFTSINTEQRKKGKKPVNPKLKPKKSIFGKFFNKNVQ